MFRVEGLGLRVAAGNILKLRGATPADRMQSFGSLSVYIDPASSRHGLRVHDHDPEYVRLLGETLLELRVLARSPKQLFNPLSLEPSRSLQGTLKGSLNPKP